MIGPMEVFEIALSQSLIANNLKEIEKAKAAGDEAKSALALQELHRVAEKLLAIATKELDKTGSGAHRSPLREKFGV